MSQAIRTAASGRLPVLLRDIALVLVLNTVVAGVLSLFSFAAVPVLTAAQRQHILVVQMVYSQAIGLGILGPIEWARLSWWWQRRPGWRGLAAVTAAAIPTGYLLGGKLAAWLTSTPFDPVMQDGFFLAVIGAVTVIASLLAVYFITQRERLAEERSRAESADLLARHAQLQLLQQQIEPHMLFNTLANVHALIETDPARAQQLLEAMSELLHASMQMNLLEWVSLEQEFALLRHYLQVMAMRMGRRLSYSVSLPPGLGGFKLPPLLVQPLVENAVKHGLEPSVGGGSIHVLARAEHGRLLVEVRDDGLGLQGEDPFASTRIGLGNVRKRLDLAFGGRASLHLCEHPPHGVQAVLDMPL